MSFQMLAWAAEQTTGSPTRKAVLMSIANAANHHTGQCNPRISRICDETEYGRSAVKAALEKLVEDGFLARTRRRREDGTLSTYQYSFPAFTETTLQGREVALVPGSADTPSPGSGGDPQNLELLNQEEREEPYGSSLTRVNATRTTASWKVDRKSVNEQEQNLAVAVLTYWNEQTGQSLQSKDWLAKIVMRAREHPELTVADHEWIVTRSLEDPWWKGVATPSVIYGSSSQFERQMMAVSRNGGRVKGSAEDAYRIACEALGVAP